MSQAKHLASSLVFSALTCIDGGIKSPSRDLWHPSPSPVPHLRGKLPVSVWAPIDTPKDSGVPLSPHSSTLPLKYWSNLPKTATTTDFSSWKQTLRPVAYMAVFHLGPKLAGQVHLQELSQQTQCSNDPRAPCYPKRTGLQGSPCLEGSFPYPLHFEPGSLGPFRGKLCEFLHTCLFSEHGPRPLLTPPSVPRRLLSPTTLNSPGTGSQLKLLIPPTFNAVPEPNGSNKISRMN